MRFRIALDPTALGTERRQSLRSPAGRATAIAGRADTTPVSNRARRRGSSGIAGNRPSPAILFRGRPGRQSFDRKRMNNHYAVAVDARPATPQVPAMGHGAMSGVGARRIDGRPLRARLLATYLGL